MPEDGKLLGGSGQERDSPSEIKEGKVEFHYIDFQDEKNEALTKGYKVGGPTLIVAQVVGNKVKEYKNLTEIWTKVRRQGRVSRVRSRTTSKNYLK